MGADEESDKDKEKEEDNFIQRNIHSLVLTLMILTIILLVTGALGLIGTLSYILSATTGFLTFSLVFYDILYPNTGDKIRSMLKISKSRGGKSSLIKASLALVSLTVLLWYFNIFNNYSLILGILAVIIYDTFILGVGYE